MSPSSIKVPISLSADDMTRQWLYFRSVPRTDEERSKSIHKSDTNIESVPINQTVINGRECPNRDDLTLDVASFELVPDFDVSSKFSRDDFYKMQSGEAAEGFDPYHEAVQEYVLAKLGCDKVICFHSQVRNAEKVGSEGGGGGVQGYAGGGPHTDSSPVSADQLAMDMLGRGSGDGDEGEDDDSGRYGRYAYINLWRNISDESPIQNDHLAMMDERTAVKPDDYIPRDLFMDGSNSVVQYGLNARHAHLHKWYYFPQMTSREAILFKQMDSDHTKTGRICFHMSINDPEGPSSPPRESIETRMFCYWKADDAAADGSTMPTPANTHKDMIKDPQQFADDLAAGVLSTSLESASVLALLLTLASKIPLLGRLLPSPSTFSSSTSTSNQKYSGNPEDYAPRFVEAVKAFPMWPSFAKTYVRNVIKKANDYDEGVRDMTKLLVDDSMGYQKTKTFDNSEKKEICVYLLSHEPYLAEVKNHFGDLY